MTNAQPREGSLQRQQEDFDLAHGLHAIGSSGITGGSGIDLGIAQFAILGLCGECGEAANAIKKAVRAASLSQDTSLALQQARSELADAFAYLLKAASILHVDLEEEFLETVAMNCLRFPPTPQGKVTRLIGLAGDGAAIRGQELAELIQNGTRNVARIVTIPINSGPSPESVDAWLKQTHQMVTDALSEANGNYVLLVNDPSLSFMLLRHGNRGLPLERRLELLRSWLHLEQTIWASASLRRLVLLPGDYAESIKTKLSQHGAITAAATEDWQTVASTLLR